MTLRQGDRVELEISHPVAGGRMLARHDGQVALVAGAIPGERVVAIVDRVSRGVIWAIVAEITAPSPKRRVGASDPACGGLAYSHIDYDHQCVLKGLLIADAFRRIGKRSIEPPPVAASPERGYRLRARLHLRHRRAGFYREGTHDLCDPAETGQLTAATMTAVETTLTALGPRAADCESLIVAEDVSGHTRVVHLTPQPGVRLDGAASPMPLPEGVSGLTADARDGIATLAGEPLVIDTSEALAGNEWRAVTDPSRPLAWTRRAPSFFQANRFLVGPLARRVVELAAGDHVADLYSGVGLFALSLAAHGARVLAVEGDRMSGEDLLVNAEPWRDRVDVLHTPVETALQETPSVRPDVIVVDPPRTGLSPEALAGVIRWNPSRVVYVSCDPPTLARDGAALGTAGYGLQSLEAFDCFPNTPHVESLAVFDQRSR